MAEAKSREGWSRTSAVLAMTANCHRDPKKSKAFIPADFNPHERMDKDKPLVRTKDLGLLKQIFVDKEKQR
jgi:hypothetical protein